MTEHLLSLWTQPRATIQRIIDDNPEQHVALLVLIMGMAAAMPNLAAPEGGLAGFALALLLAPIIMVISLYLTGWLYRIVGGWLGGKGEGRQLRAAIAWAYVPQILLNIIWLLLFLVAPQAMSAGAESLVAEPQAMTWLWYGIALVLGLWGLVIHLKMVGQVHGFSAWRALGTALLSVVLVALVIGVPVGLIAALAVA
ncbi:YIP1 family protein [Gallaecimonas sp. GXIMD4217]|uniref:YIP1 family protein n=1 Tax=Gallaecimonas sp. GXIMD4217 TaxID=3131927 RepID=UPI00311B300B